MSVQRRLVKLVRDRVPEVVPDGVVVYAQVSPELHRKWLRRKLLEEALEYLEDPTVEELCDVLEVVETLALVEHGISLADLEVLRDDKHQARGGFIEGIAMFVSTTEVG